MDCNSLKHSFKKNGSVQSWEGDSIVFINYFYEGI